MHNIKRSEQVSVTPGKVVFGRASEGASGSQNADSLVSIAGLDKPAQVTNARQTAGRVALTLLGALVMGLGVALAQWSNTGNSPISCIPAVLYVAGEKTGLDISLGTLTFIINVAFIGGEWLLLRKRFPLAQLLQVPLVFAFSASIDFFMTLFMPLLPHDSVVAQYVLLAASIPAVALGVHLMILGDTVMTPPEAFIRLVAGLRGKKYSDYKVPFDVMFLVTGVVLSFVLLGGLEGGVREGTIIAAVFTGFAVKGWEHLLGGIERRVPTMPTPIRPLPTQPAEAKLAA